MFLNYLVCVFISQFNLIIHYVFIYEIDFLFIRWKIWKRFRVSWRWIYPKNPYSKHHQHALILRRNSIIRTYLSITGSTCTLSLWLQESTKSPWWDPMRGWGDPPLTPLSQLLQPTLSTTSTCRNSFGRPSKVVSKLVHPRVEKDWARGSLTWHALFFPYK